MGAGLLLGPFGQLSVELPGEYAGLYATEAAEPLNGGDDLFREKAL